MKKLIYGLVVSSLALVVLSPTKVLAQSGTQSAESTQSAQSTQSAESSGSALPSELPQTGAADVFILTAAGLIFISAGIFSARTANEVFTEIQDE